MQDIDLEGFNKFMSIFLEVEAPEELCRHLFLSFLKKPNSRGQSDQVGSLTQFNFIDPSSLKKNFEVLGKVNDPTTIHAVKRKLFVVSG